MPERERDKSVLEHMLSYCVDIEETVERFGDSYEAFSNDKAYRNACAMCILQIGGACRAFEREFPRRPRRNAVESDSRYAKRRRPRLREH